MREGEESMLMEIERGRWDWDEGRGTKGIGTESDKKGGREVEKDPVGE